MEKQTAKKEHGGVFGQGEPNVNYAQYFVGNSYLKPLTDPKETNIFMANVTFEPANVKHWHGATANSWFSHRAVEVPGENTSNEWCEKVTDEEYNKLDN